MITKLIMGLDQQIKQNHLKVQFIVSGMKNIQVKEILKKKDMAMDQLSGH